MALRAVLGFDRMVNVESGVKAGNRIPGTPLFNQTSGQDTSQWRSADGFLQLRGYYSYYSNTNVVKTVGATLPAKSVFQTLSGTSRVTLGARIKVDSASTGLHLQGVVGGSLTTFTIIGTSDVYPATPELGAVSSGKTFYAEYTIDVADKAIYRWLDGVAIATLTLPDWVVDKFTNAQDFNLAFGYHTTFTQPTNISSMVLFKDIYILEKTADGIMNDRLGPQVVKPLPPASFDANGWTSSAGGTPLAAVQTANTTSASLSDPLVTSDANESPATVKLSATAVGTKINGVVLVEEAKRGVASDARLKNTVTEGATSVDGAVVTLTDTVDNYLPFYIASQSPAGSRFTKSIIESLAIKVQPVTGA